MSPFFSSHQVSYKRQIAAPLQTVLAFLHDPPALMGLSPVIVEVTVDPKDQTKYSIVDSLLLPFGFRTRISYTATIILHDDGMEAESAAGAGTRTHVRYTVRAVSEDKTEIEEVTTANCFFLLSPYIKGVIEKAHNETLDRMAAKLEGKEWPA
ncbi:SWIM-type domain-containing protein [Favolaschia claudopus]|uniref:SWIM-type domain-containing protein n=1 Tax=Favolaschia claudopus TaxID=2862362 RepID=A0AAW0BI80_9AGAR